MAFNYGDIIGGLTSRYSGTSPSWTGGGSGQGTGWLSSITGGGGSSWSSVLGTVGNWASKFLGGGSSSGSTGNIYEGILGGLGSAADAYISKEAVEESGRQQRKTYDFKMQLDDYYAQRNKVRKRAALDTYGQFSTMDRWAPGAKPAPALDQPAKPGVG